ncbi:MAG: phosphotransferase [Dongiaceae bacterium]
MPQNDPSVRAARLGCWSGPVEPIPLAGGITNANFLVQDRGRRCFVRVGDDIPVHGILRFHELAASEAAAAIGLSPAVIHHEPGAIVFDYIEGRTYGPEDVRRSDNLKRILPLLRACHHELPKRFRGPALIFWVFQIFRDYALTLRDCDSRMLPELPRLLAIAAELERQVGPVDIVFGHNDLLPGNFIDDGKKLWLIDWDYAGFNSPLFDLGNLCSNNDVAPADEEWLLEGYFERPVTDELRRRFHAMKCASLLREAMWSMVSEHRSKLDFDYVAYTADYLARFDRAIEALRHL